MSPADKLTDEELFCDKIANLWAHSSGSSKNTTFFTDSFVEIDRGYFQRTGITDRLDGYVARKTKTESSLGALLDLIADKLLICIVLLWVTFYIGESYLLIPTIIIISRELLVSTIRQFLAETYGKNPIKVSFIAKSKTTLQVIATSLCLISPNFDELFMQIAIFSLWLSALVSIYSLYDYLTAYKIKIK